MTSKQITENVYYVGVNDRTTTLFESLWPLPMGVSYNSYVVKGEATALIDTVELHTLPDLLLNLKQIGVDTIDYLIVNHMEPDHSGSLPELLKLFPDLKIVGNSLTTKMICGYYNVSTDHLLVVKDGESISLGAGLELSFHTIPMVHWPETMVTWLAARKVVFSGDAFGTFGALNGRIIDADEEVFESYMSEMRRYYACIVAKYGEPVQKALAKLAPLGAEYLCSTHGPVWHEKAPQVIDLYDCMSSDRTRPGAVVVYGSMYGHTAQMAEIIAHRLAAKGIEVRLYDLSTTHLSHVLADVWTYNTLIVGSPTYNAGLFPPVAALLSALKMRAPKQRMGATFGCYTWASAACKLITKALEDIKFQITAEPVDMKMAITDDVHASLIALADATAARILGSK